MKRVLNLLIFLAVFSCIEPYDFDLEDEAPALVIEGFISDKSFNQTLSYPSDGRFFSVRLSITSKVDNVRATPISNALVQLISSDNEVMSYTESVEKPGTYYLVDSSFSATPGIKYKLQITNSEEIVESEWQTLPEAVVPEMGPIGFVETERQAYLMEAGEKVLRTVKEIRSHVTLPVNGGTSPIYYRWEYTPTWVFRAPLSPSVTRPGYICWAKNENYLNGFALQADKQGGYIKDLFSVPTENNERIMDDLSVLIHQYSMNEQYYFFWKEMQSRVEGNVLIDTPPFNLESNFSSLTEGGKIVVGFFSVVQEQAKRWYFNKSQLSYPIRYTFKEACEVNYGPPLPGCPEPTPSFTACECKYCLDYSKGQTTNVKPIWWRN